MVFKAVRYNGRYYPDEDCNINDHYQEVGAAIIRGIPAKPKEYYEWLKKQRAKFAAMESGFEKPMSEIIRRNIPSYIFTSPSWFSYIINLDREVLTMNASIHWKLGNIPRQYQLWVRAITDSIYMGTRTIHLDLCLEEHIASPALDLPEAIQEMEYDSRVVVARSNLAEPRKMFLARTLADTLIFYKEQIIDYGREWSPDSFLFREFVFALVSIASGQVEFYPGRLNPSTDRPNSTYKCVEDWIAGNSQDYRVLPFLLPGEPPGASPTETMYWLGEVLVSLTLVVDVKAIAQAVTWGIEQKRTNFQIAVLSLFEVRFAELSLGGGGKPFVKVTDPVYLSPLRASHCMSTHPRERPVKKPGMASVPHPTKGLSTTGSRSKVQEDFPGLAALVNFFEMAESRRSSSYAKSFFPAELYYCILDFVDYNTWKTCSTVSTVMRDYCLRNYRINDQLRILPDRMANAFENIQTGNTTRIMDSSDVDPNYNVCFLVIGRDREVGMNNVAACELNLVGVDRDYEAYSS